MDRGYGSCGKGATCNVIVHGNREVPLTKGIYGEASWGTMDHWWCCSSARARPCRSEESHEEDRVARFGQQLYFDQIMVKSILTQNNKAPFLLQFVASFSLLFQFYSLEIKYLRLCPYLSNFTHFNLTFLLKSKFDLIYTFRSSGFWFWFWFLLLLLLLVKANFDMVNFDWLINFNQFTRLIDYWVEFWWFNFKQSNLSWLKFHWISFIAFLYDIFVIVFFFYLW